MKINRREMLVATGVAAGFNALSSRSLFAASSEVRVVGLKVDYLDKPLGLENVRPWFSWRLEAARRNVRQSAYRICVASDPRILEAGCGDLWDSGKIVSNRSLSIPYEGKALKSRQHCWWRVQVWDEAGRLSTHNEVSEWEMGLLTPDDWMAQWIAVDDAIAVSDRETQLHWMWDSQAPNQDEVQRRFRSTFFLSKPTQGGTLFALGRGHEQVIGAWIDGAPISVDYPDRDMTRENLPLGPLAAGEHRVQVAVRRKSPWPETYFVPPKPGLACFIRLDADAGKPLLRLGDGADWETSLDDKTWKKVSTEAVEKNVIVDPAMYLRREFSIEKSVSSARLYATALGCYEARLNGRRVGDALLTPEISQYEKRVLYRVYDVRDLLRNGGNALGLVVGDGWYASHPDRYSWGPAPRRALAQLELTFADGSRQVIATDSDWRISRSPIRQSEFDFGEIYDARLEQPNWDTADFDDSNWQTAQRAATPPCRVAAQVAPPVRAIQALKPIRTTSPLYGVYVFDFGQNFSGWCRLRVKGAAGERVDLRFGEQLKPSGELDQFVLLGGKAVDTYVLRGDPAGETFEPHFVYHGFRYVQVTGLPVAPSQDSLEGIVIHSDLPFTGKLRIAHPLLQKLWERIVWTQRSNFVAIPTDCPNRAERMAYFADNSIFWDTAAFNMDVAALARRTMDDARDHQYRSGAFAPLAPSPAEFAVYKSADDTATPIWSDGGVILPWKSWRHYDDRGLIEQNWQAMNRYLQFIEDRNPNYLWLNGRKPDLGDWLAIDEKHFMKPEIPPTTPFDLLATAYWAYSAELLAQMAEATGRDAEARRLRFVRARVRDAFIAKFVRPDGAVGNGSQTSYLVALKFDLVPDDLRRKAVEHLTANIRKRGTALSTGIAGTQFMLDVLTDAGLSELAYSLLLRTEYPSWGYMIERGATTIWEQWDGSLDHRSATASHNHFALGAVGAFLFRRVAGIDAIEPGFQRIRVCPLLDPRVKRGGGDYDSVMGRISTDWTQLDDGGLTLNVTVPPNCTASIHLPRRKSSRITEDGKSIARREGLRIAHQAENEIVIEAGSGQYRFQVIG